MKEKRQNYEGKKSQQQERTSRCKDIFTGLTQPSRGCPERLQVVPPQSKTNAIPPSDRDRLQALPQDNRLANY